MTHTYATPKHLKNKKPTFAQRIGIETLKFAIVVCQAIAVIDFAVRDEYTFELLAWFVISMLVLVLAAGAVDRLEKSIARRRR